MFKSLSNSPPGMPPTCYQGLSRSFGVTSAFSSFSQRTLRLIFKKYKRGARRGGAEDAEGGSDLTYGSNFLIIPRGGKAPQSPAPFLPILF